MNVWAVYAGCGGGGSSEGSLSGGVVAVVGDDVTLRPSRRRSSLRAAMDALALARPLEAVSSSLLVSPAPGAVRALGAWAQKE
eukprot:894789-Prymnesium_polylepis.1